MFANGLFWAVCLRVCKQDCKQHCKQVLPCVYKASGGEVFAGLQTEMQTCLQTVFANSLFLAFCKQTANSIANRFCPVFIRLRAGSCLRDCLHKGASGVGKTKCKIKGTSLLPCSPQKTRRAGTRQLRNNGQNLAGLPLEPPENTRPPRGERKAKNQTRAQNHQNAPESNFFTISTHPPSIKKNARWGSFSSYGGYVGV